MQRVIALSILAALLAVCSTGEAFGVDQDESWTGISDAGSVARTQDGIDSSAIGAWRNATGTIGPSRRDASGLVYDPEADKYVLFGGYEWWTQKALGDTWLFDPVSSRWSNVTAPGGPSPRQLPAMAFEPWTKRVVLFGGGMSGPPWSLNDTWTFDTVSGTWTNVSPPVSPQARAGAAASPIGPGGAQIGGGLLLFGGSGVTPFNDLWHYNASNYWYQFNQSVAPMPRFAHDFLWMPDRGTAVAVGGFQPAGPYDSEAWEYDADNNIWTSLLPSPPPRVFHSEAAVYDTISRRVVAYNYDLQTNRIGLTLLDVQNRTVSNLNTSYGPSARWNASMAFDTRRGEAMLHGGSLANPPWGLVNETWLWNGSSPSTPWINSHVPSDGATNVETGSPVVIGFTEPMEPSSTRLAFSIDPPVSGGSLQGGVTEVNFTHNDSFQPSTLYTVRLASTAKSASGGYLPANFSFSFTTKSSGPTPPVIVSHSPANQSQDVPPIAIVSVTFSENMDPLSTISDFSVTPQVAGGSASVVGTTLTWNHASPFSPSTDYFVNFNGTAKSAAGAPLGAQFGFTFRTAAGPTVPRIVSVSPPNGSKDMGPFTGFRIEFSEPMDKDLVRSEFGVLPPFVNATSSVTDTVVTWTPYDPLPESTTFKAIVTSKAKSAAGVPLGTTQWFEFTSGAAPPGTPRVVKTWPVDGETEVLLNASVVIEFDVDMDPASLIAEFSIAPPVGSGSVIPQGKFLLFDHSSPLAGDTHYTVHLNGTVKSATGAAMGPDFNFSFTTAGGPPSYPVSGRVTDEKGDPVKGAKVEARRVTDDNLVATAVTDATGYFKLDLPAGAEYYLVVVYPDGSREKSDPFALTGPKTQSFQKGASEEGGAGSVLLAGAVGAALLIGLVIAILVIRMRRGATTAPQSSTATPAPPGEETVRAAKELEERAKRAEAVKRAVERTRERPGGPG